MKTCNSCQSKFEITPADRIFYDRMSLPDPSLCQYCRDQRRLAFRNERHLYKRTSDLSGKSIISYISTDKPYKIFTQEEWWSDKWDPLAYGRDFDFERPFFEQLNELMIEVPMMNLTIWQSENCDYCNYVDFCRNCYLLFAASNSEDCYYSNLIDTCKDCMDCMSLKESELCYDSIDCVQCNRVIGSIKCENSHDLAFCFDCRGCEDCVGCFNLNHKKYHIFNKPYSSAEFEERKKKIDFQSRAGYSQAKKSFLDFVKNQAIHRAVNNINCENCSGDNLVNSKNSNSCFQSNGLNDCAYVQFSMNCTDSRDIYGSSKVGCELSCEAISIEGKNIVCGYYIAGHSNVYYSNFVAFCNNVFGCVGLKHKEYCILNKQYSKAEYEDIVGKIIQHMKRTGWERKEGFALGEFFSPIISPFAYNETVAQEYYPLNKEECLKRGWKWKDFEGKSDFLGGGGLIPDRLSDVDGRICNQVFQCGRCSKNYKIVVSELAMNKKIGVPLPIYCPDCRHADRLSLRNPRKLWFRNCDKCSMKIQSSYSPERTEKVYCEKCCLALNF